MSSSHSLSHRFLLHSWHLSIMSESKSLYFYTFSVRALTECRWHHYYWNEMSPNDWWEAHPNQCRLHDKCLLCQLWHRCAWWSGTPHTFDIISTLQSVQMSSSLTLTRRTDWHFALINNHVKLYFIHFFLKVCYWSFH